jgi:hypothetical protein
LHLSPFFKDKPLSSITTFDLERFKKTRKEANASNGTVNRERKDNKMWKNTVLHRDELYKKVWATPMTQLAGQYGLSDRWLAKICKKLNVPVPPRGYRAAIKSGITSKN